MEMDFKKLTDKLEEGGDFTDIYVKPVQEAETTKYAVWSTANIPQRPMRQQHCVSCAQRAVCSGRRGLWR